VKATGKLEVFADIWCPFAHVGLRAAMAVRTANGIDGSPFVIRAWPLELVNGAPMDVRSTSAHIQDLREQVAPDMFRGFDEEDFPSTSLPALALAHLAYDQAPSTGEAVSMALRDALFEEGRNIARREVLEEIADDYGMVLDGSLGDEGVLDDWRRGRERGVKGSPHFFCHGSEAFCPSLDIESDSHGHLSLRRNADQLSQFLLGCFTDQTKPSER
jgi:predicted DsbA family dithiol-disulfide isomerase